MKNVEIKARYEEYVFAREVLSSLNATSGGTDHQIDTYFNVSDGRLKLRQGNVENALISYKRPNIIGPKESDYRLFRMTGKEPTLKDALTHALGVKVEVDKLREIYFVGNVKIHLDTVLGLGTFIEIEARDETDTVPVDELQQQCNEFIAHFKIKEENFIHESYSDMMLARNDNPSS